MRKLTQLRIDEVSAVIKGANPGARVLIRKHDADPPYLFDDIMRKGNDPRSGQPPNSATDADKAPLSAQLDEIVAEMIAATGGDLHPDRARRWLLHTEQGQALLAQHTKKEEPMNRIEEMQEMHKFVKSGGMLAVAKHIIETGSTSLTEPEYTELVQEDAALRKVSFEKAFADPTTQQGYKIVREAGYLKSLVAIAPGSYDVIKGMPTLTPTSVVVGNTNFADDSAEAVRLLSEMAAKNGSSFEAVFSNPANAKLAARTYTSAHRSSPSYGSEEQ
jgi:hypothetical protein